MRTNARAVRQLLVNANVDFDDKLAITATWNAATASDHAFHNGDPVSHRFAANQHRIAASLHTSNPMVYFQHLDAANIHDWKAATLGRHTANTVVGSRSHPRDTVLPHRAGSTGGRTRSLAGRGDVLVPHVAMVANAKTGGSNSDDAGEGDEELYAGGYRQGYADGRGKVKGGNRSRAGGVEESWSEEPGGARHIDSGSENCDLTGYHKLFPDVGDRFDGRQVDTLTREGPDGFEEDSHTVASVMAALPPSIPLEELVGDKPSASPKRSLTQSDFPYGDR
jgi:hypothetical protein